MTGSRKIVSGSEDGVVILWKLGKVDEVARTALHSGSIVDLAIHPSSGHVFAISLGHAGSPSILFILKPDLSATVWIAELPSAGFAIAVNGQRIVIAHQDGTLTLWQWTAE